MKRTHLLILVPLLLFGRGALSAQAKPLEEKAWLDLVVPTKVELQLVNQSGRYTGIDFNTKKIIRDLPDCAYDPLEAISDDETGAPDTNPVQHLTIGFVRPETFTLKVRTQVSGTQPGELVITDRMRRNKRIKLLLPLGQSSVVREYRLILDPIDAAKCHLEPIGR